MTVTAQPPVRRSRSFGAGVLAVILGAAVLLVGPAAKPAHACSCMQSTEEEYFARADAVFRGRMVAYQPPPSQPTMSSADPVVWTFAVAEIYKGAVAPSQPIVSSRDGASCGLHFPDQMEFFVFATRRDLYGQESAGELYAFLCGGTRATADGPLAVAALQPPTTDTTTPPTPTTEVPPTTTATTVAPTTTEPAPTTTVTVAPLRLERQGTGAPETETVAASEDADGGLSAGVVVAVALAALVGVSGIGLYLRRLRHPA